MERTKSSKPTVTPEQVSEFAIKWGYKTRYDEDDNTLSLRRAKPRSKTFYYKEAIIAKIKKKFGKLPFAFE